VSPGGGDGGARPQQFQPNLQMVEIIRKFMNVVKEGNIEGVMQEIQRLGIDLQQIIDE